MQKRRLISDIGFWSALIILVIAMGFIRLTSHRIEPGVQESLDNAARALSENRIETAVEQFRKAIKGSKDKVDIYLQAASAFYSAGESRGGYRARVQAAVFAKELIELHDRNILKKKLTKDELINVLSLYGDLCYRLGRADSAISAMKRAYALRPDNPSLANQLGYTYAEFDRNLPEALVLIRKALKKLPDNPAIIDSLGWVYFKMGRNKEAIVELERAVRLAPDQAELRCHLGFAYAEEGKPIEAAIELKKALALDPDLVQARVLLSKLNQVSK